LTHRCIVFYLVFYRYLFSSFLFLFYPFFARMFLSLIYRNLLKNKRFGCCYHSVTIRSVLTVLNYLPSDKRQTQKKTLFLLPSYACLPAKNTRGKYCSFCYEPPPPALVSYRVGQRPDGESFKRPVIPPSQQPLN
jgi:hypothetical protein